LKTVSSTFLLLAITTAPAFVACGGGGVGSPAQRGIDISSGKLVLAIPASASTESGARRMFLSPSTVSVAISVSGIATPVVADVSNSSTLCATNSETRTCSIPVSAPAGTDTFTATLYTAANATGTILGAGTATQAIASGEPFSLSLAVNGVAASVELSATQKQFTAGVPASTTLIVHALDAGGNTIAGTYQYPITINDSDTTGTFTVTPANVSNSTTTVTLAYSGGLAATTATITADGTNVPVTSLSTQVVSIGGNGPFTLTPNSLTLLGIAVVATVAIADPTAYTGTYSCASANQAVATATIAGKTITVTAVGIGATTLTVSTTDGRTVTVPITVTTTTIPIQ
jgi:hypothetical protein